MRCSILLWMVGVWLDWGLWTVQAVSSWGACPRVAQDGPFWVTVRPPVLPTLPGGWGPWEAEEVCLTQAHMVTRGLGPGAFWGLAS